MFGRGEINLQEGVLEAFQHMNPQQLVNILLSDEDWHVKTSNGNASGG